MDSDLTFKVIVREALKIALLGRGPIAAYVCKEDQLP